MAVQVINIGNVANDGTGDDLREAFIKVNANFEELDLRDDEQTTVSNLGAEGEGLYYNKVNYDLQFKKIIGGDNITLTATDDNITISNDLSAVVQSDVEGDTFVNKEFTFDGRIKYNNVYATFADLPDATTFHGMFAHVHDTGAAYFAHAGAWVELANKDETFTEVAADLTPQLGGNLDAQGFNLLNVGNINAAEITGAFIGNLTGNVVGNVHGYDIRDWAKNNAGFDFGGISPDFTSILELFISTVDVDFGTYGSPADYNVDLGTI
jgi:hypothetical protein